MGCGSTYAPSGPGDVTHVNARLGRKFGKIGNFIEISAQHTSNILAIGVKISRLTTVNDRNMRRIPVAINRSDLVSKLADKAGTTKTDADSVLSALSETLLEAVGKGEKVQIPGILPAERVERSARTGRHPATGETINSPAGYGVQFIAGRMLKSAVK